jgi:hypothetical protein
MWPLGVSSFCGTNSDQHFYIQALTVFYSGSDILYSGIDILYSGIDILYLGIDILYSGIDILYLGIDVLNSGKDILYSDIDLLYSVSWTLRRECVRTPWMRAPYWGRGGRTPKVVTRSVS